MPERPDLTKLANPSQWKTVAGTLSAKGREGKAWRAAMAVAVLSDAVSMLVHFLPPVQIWVDLGTVLLLMLCLRWRWAFLIALIPEAFPGTAMLPFWVLVVAALAALQKTAVDTEVTDVEPKNS